MSVRRQWCNNFNKKWAPLKHLQTKPANERSEAFWSSASKVIKKQCVRLTKTQKYVKVVKKTIVALRKCPGLGDVKFSIPKWVGQWAYFKQQKNGKDKWNDQKMLGVCKSEFGPRARPAEVSEIDSHTIRRMPRHNTALAPVLGACPMCAGEKNGKLSAEGHGRKCWDKKVKFNHKARRGDCNHGKRAIICVLDQSSKPRPQTRR